MRLWHVSEQPGIQVFEPRVPPSSSSGLATPIVWAVDDDRLAHYLVPRECPRVAFYALPTSSSQDLDCFFGPGSAQHVVAIETAWLERARSTRLWLYQLPPESFSCVDANAGYHVSERAVRPLASHHVADPPAQLASRGVELRVMRSLWPLARAVVGSSVAFSCIRMRNAMPDGKVMPELS